VSRPNYSDSDRRCFRPYPSWAGLNPAFARVVRKSGQRPDSVVHLLEEPGGGSGPQSMQTPIGSVTARPLGPSQGGVPPPKRAARAGGPAADDPQKVLRRIGRVVSAVAAVAPPRAFATLGPFAAENPGPPVDEFGDVGFAPTRRLQVFAQLARDDDRVITGPD